MTPDREILLCPGPVMLSPAVRAALADCEIGHRDARFSQVLSRLRQRSRRVFRAGDEHSVMFLGGPATAAIEAVCATLLGRESRVLVLHNGAFGARIAEILTVHGIGHASADFGFGQAFDLARLEAILAAERGLGAIALTHHETSAGVLNPVPAVSALARQHGLKLIVDATSSAGVEDLSVARDGIDACITTSGKCLHGAPGLSLVCVRRDWLAESRARPPRSYSLDLHRYHDALESRRQTPFTASVPLFVALDQALEELLESGIEARRRTYRHRREILASGLARIGLPLLPIPADAQSSSILTVAVPDGQSFEVFYAALKAQGFVVYGCKPPLAPRYFQVAVMGELADEDLHDFVEVVRAQIEAAAAPALGLPAPSPRVT
ncbi:MAG TPA: aminotransferase class V-fold PLP-dependent enzyme [Burkholderiales bacterium]|nr:aminotransferase class V-fold PLP-dependent enzyme [Burkholderiales bacterium]